MSEPIKVCAAPVGGGLNVNPDGSIAIRGHELAVGDDLWFLGTVHRITRFVPYDPRWIGLPAEDGWRIACEGPFKAHEFMTIEPMGRYFIKARPGETRKNLGWW